MAALIAHGLAAPDERPAFAPLAGGVSCDVFRVDLRSGSVCVKQALPRLRVAGDWQAAPERSHAEALWLREAPVLRVTAPRLLLEVPECHLLVMEYLPAQTHPVWKDRLMNGESDPAFATQVGHALAGMHRGSWGSRRLAGQFANDTSFEALRIDPFLRQVARIHSDLAPAIGSIIDRLAPARIALAHGDFSPKNILCGPDGPVILDAECAVFGNPAFDLAFCLAHLLLKARHVGPILFDDVDALAAAYAEGMGELAGAVQDDAILLVAALMLARVDGKSPAGYLREEERQAVREAARRWLTAAPPTLTALIDDWRFE